MHRYEKTTRGVRVAVTPRYLDDHSNADDQRFVWAYDIEILNDGPVTVQLQTRAWDITDANGHCERVRGPGVVGEQPILNPGDEFRYSSGCPLTTPSGFMVGSYTMSSDTGEEFEVAIPAFSLDLPGAMGTFN